MATQAEEARASSKKPPSDDIDVYGITHAGKVRADNEDHFLIAELRKQMEVRQTSLPDVQGLPTGAQRMAFMAMVADGVGGGHDGEEASRLAVAAVTRYVADSIHAYYSAGTGEDGAFARLLEEATLRVHEDLVSLRSEDPERGSMATTLTLFLGVWPRAYLVQVGDSRYYILKDDELWQVSRDQTIGQDLVDSGVLGRDQASSLSWADALSSSIGGSESAPAVTAFQNDLSYVHLLCSDGLTKHVSDERIRERLSTMTSARQACEDLLQDALDGGGSDNITMIVGRAIPRSR